MPFHPRQVDSAVENMKTWAQFLPCQAPRNISFIFYLAKKESAAISDHLLQQFNELPLTARCCFQSVSVVYEQELEAHDSYLLGSRLMFEKMISGELDYGDKAPSFVFYMEPDCKPVQNDWLEAIIDAVRPPNEYFWMKGSSFRGSASSIHQNPPIYTLLHINGNAIYNVGDGKLFIFYSLKVRPFLLNHNASEAYDTDIFKCLLWDYKQRVQDYLHLFVHTNKIQNKWHSNFSRKELFGGPFNNTVLVHGGKMTD